MSKCNKTVTLIFCVFLGYLGIHHFYARKNKMGLIYLFTAGLFGIGWIVDIILICTDKYKDSNGIYITDPTDGEKPLLIPGKARNGIVIGIAAIFGISIIAAPVSTQDTETAETIDTTISIIETISEEYDGDYIDVNDELIKITKEAMQKETTETGSEEIIETTTQESTTAETEIQEITETPITTTAYTTISIETTKTDAAYNGFSNNNNGNSSENHFTDYDIPEQQNTTEYVLNTESNKFHKPTCSTVKLISPENYATVSSREEAINNGYEPCGRCNP